MIRTLAMFITVFLLSGGLRAQSATSASFSLDSASSAAAAEGSGSASYRVDSVLGHAGPIGASSSASYLFQGGPLSYLGIGQVPMLLGVRLMLTPSPTVRLDWSGTGPNFTVFRATNCAMVGVSPVATQVQSSYLDPSAPGETLVCYLIQ